MQYNISVHSYACIHMLHCIRRANGVALLTLNKPSFSAFVITSIYICGLTHLSAHMLVQSYNILPS